MLQTDTILLPRPGAAAEAHRRSAGHRADAEDGGRGRAALHRDAPTAASPEPAHQGAAIGVGAGVVLTAAGTDRRRVTRRRRFRSRRCRGISTRERAHVHSDISGAVGRGWPRDLDPVTDLSRRDDECGPATLSLSTGWPVRWASAHYRDAAGHVSVTVSCARRRPGWLQQRRQPQLDESSKSLLHVPDIRTWRLGNGSVITRPRESADCHEEPRERSEQRRACSWTALSGRGQCARWVNGLRRSWIAVLIGQPFESATSSPVLPP